MAPIAIKIASLHLFASRQRTQATQKIISSECRQHRLRALGASPTDSARAGDYGSAQLIAHADYLPASSAYHLAVLASQNETQIATG